MERATLEEISVCQNFISNYISITISNILLYYIGYLEDLFNGSQKVPSVKKCSVGKIFWQMIVEPLVQYVDG